MLEVELVSGCASPTFATFLYVFIATFLYVFIAAFLYILFAAHL